MLTRRGGRWHVSTVMNLLDRLGALGGGMRQSRLMSLVEGVVYVVVGLLVAVAMQLLVFPILGLHATLGQNVKLALVFTGVSIARSYALRWPFEVLTWVRR